MKKVFIFAAMALATLLVPNSANAAVVIDVTEGGGNVTFAVTGNLNLTGATLFTTFSSYGLGFIPGGSNWYVAPGPGGSVDSYALTGFAGAFGTSGSFFSPPSSVSGDNFYIWGAGGATAQVGVTSGYVSGSAINSGMVFNGATIAGLFMTPGTYLYTLPNDTITLNIGDSAGVPEPGTFSLIGLGMAGAAIAARRRKQ